MKKKVIQININFSNRFLYGLITLVFLLIVSVGVYATGHVTHVPSEITGLKGFASAGIGGASSGFGGCPDPNYGIKTINVDTGAVTCEKDEVNDVVSTGELDGVCNIDGKILKRASGTWACGVDDKVTLPTDLGGLNNQIGNTLYAGKHILDIQKLDDVLGRGNDAGGKTITNLVSIQGKNNNLGIIGSVTADNVNLGGTLTTSTIQGEGNNLRIIGSIHGLDNLDLEGTLTVDNINVEGALSGVGNNLHIIGSIWGIDNLNVVGALSGEGNNLQIVGSIHGIDNINANAFFYTSDISLKENIKPLSNSLWKIQQLKGVSFDWKENGKSSFGLIAQDVEKVFPLAVSNNEETGFKSVDYAKLVAPLIDSVKTQQKQIQKQENKINDLQRQINELKGR